jgi:hypothetical protein
MHLILRLVVDQQDQVDEDFRSTPKHAYLFYLHPYIIHQN